MKKHYVLGFMFSESRLMMALIQKEKPAWQAGRLNGIGGKVEDFDDGIDAAMRREFLEETGVDHDDWDYVLRMEGPYFQMDVFRAFTDKVNQVKTTTDEKVRLLAVPVVQQMLLQAPDLFIDNMQWVLPYVLDGGSSSSGEGHGGRSKPCMARVSYT